MDQKQSNGVSKVIGVVFILFGFCMLCLGVSLLFAPNKATFEITLTFLFLLSGGLMLFGGIQGIKKANQKDIALSHYRNEIQKQINEIKPNGNSNHPKNSGKPNHPEINQSSKINQPEIYVPDIIAHWKYTKEEWKLMTEAEVKRRLKEGIWVSLLVMLLAGWVLYKSKGVSMLLAFGISLGVGIVVSLIKVQISNSLFRSSKNNSLLITSNALIINGRYKVFKDMDIRLEYVKAVQVKENQFIEFSLQWQTRRGVTNDQIRIYVPKANESDIGKVIGYFN